jgi:hypothetical protein
MKITSENDILVGDGDVFGDVVLMMVVGTAFIVAVGVVVVVILVRVISLGLK